MGAGRDLLTEIGFDAGSLFLLGVAIIYYGSFFLMMYNYAYVEEKIWR
jgi:hypothetical protein